MRLVRVDDKRWVGKTQIFGREHWAIGPNRLAVRRTLMRIVAAEAKRLFKHER